MGDRVNLPRLYFAWHSPSRLYNRLVYDLKHAQDVSVGNPVK
jgi:hypothetical protein